MTESGTRQKAKLVMFVEDNIDSREPFAIALRQEGLLVDEVATLTEALVIAPRLLPDIIVLDRHLPDGDGWDAARRFRSIEALKNVPIIAFTSNVKGRADVEDALVAGCDVFLEKPSFPSVLVRHVLGLLGLPLPEERQSESRVRKRA